MIFKIIMHLERDIEALFEILNNCDLTEDDMIRLKKISRRLNDILPAMTSFAKDSALPQYPRPME